MLLAPKNKLRMTWSSLEVCRQLSQMQLYKYVCIYMYIYMHNLRWTHLSGRSTFSSWSHFSWFKHLTEEAESNLA